MTPIPIPLRLQDMVAGLQQDPVTRKLGRADGEAGMFRLSVDDILGRGDDIDVLAYLTGWLEGTRNRTKAGRS
jgi:hypothetical protein